MLVERIRRRRLENESSFVNNEILDTNDDSIPPISTEECKLVKGECFPTCIIKEDDASDVSTPNIPKLVIRFGKQSTNSNVQKFVEKLKKRKKKKEERDGGRQHNHHHSHHKSEKKSRRLSTRLIFN